MKVSVTTLTGQKFEVEVEGEGTVKDLKKAFYWQSKLTSQVRLLIGQEILHDDRKLCEYQIQDGGVIRALFTPDVDVTVEVTSGYMTHKITVLNSTLVQEVKVKLADLTEDRPSTDKFDLVLEGNKLENDLPLHFYGISTGANLQIILQVISVKIEDNRGFHLFKKLKRFDTILDIKKKLRESKTKSEEVCVDYSGHPEDMRLYLVEDDGGKYRELDDNMTVDECMIPDNSKLFLLTYRWTHPDEDKNVKVYFLNTAGRCRIEGIECSDTPLVVKLRALDQLKVPVKAIKLVDEYLREVTKVILGRMHYLGTEAGIQAESARREQVEREKRIKEGERREEVAREERIKEARREEVERQKRISENSRMKRELDDCVARGEQTYYQGSNYTENSRMKRELEDFVARGEQIYYQGSNYSNFVIVHDELDKVEKELEEDENKSEIYKLEFGTEEIIKAISKEVARWEQEQRQNRIRKYLSDLIEVELNRKYHPYLLQMRRRIEKDEVESLKFIQRYGTVIQFLTEKQEQRRRREKHRVALKDQYQSRDSRNRQAKVKLEEVTRLIKEDSAAREKRLLESWRLRRELEDSLRRREEMFQFYDEDYGRDVVVSTREKLDFINRELDVDLDESLKYKKKYGTQEEVQVIREELARKAREDREWRMTQNP